MNFVIAENYLCFYALLETVISGFGISSYSQYDFANEFGVVLPHGHSISKINNISYSNNIREYGAHIDENQINSFFKRHGIDLKMAYISENPYIDYEYDKYGCFEASHQKYYIYTYSYGSLYHEPQNYMVGHVALLLNCLSNEKLEIYDPGPRKYGIKVVNRIAMHEAMEDIRGGTYVIEPISSDFLPC